MTSAHRRATAAVQSRTPKTPWVSLPEALSWIAFGAFLDEQALNSRVRKDTASSSSLEQAVRQFFTAAGGGRVKARGRHVVRFHDEKEAALADTENIPANRLKDFRQYNLDVGGLQRQESGHSLVWHGTPTQSFERAFGAYAEAESDSPGRLSEGYRGVEVWRDDLMREFPQSHSGGGAIGEAPRMGRRRELDHDEIRARARKMREEQSQITIGSAAAAIAVELPLNSKTGKRRDARGVEKIIAPIWSLGEEK